MVKILRIKNYEELLDLVNNRKSVFLISKCGGGKSYLCQIVLDKTRGIKIKTKPHFSNKKSADFIYYIFKELDNNSGIFNYCSFMEYLKRSSSKTLIKYIARNTIEEMQIRPSIFTFPFRHLFNAAKKSLIPKIERDIGNSDFSDLDNILMLNYIEYCLMQKTFILDIENFENIDEYSLDKIERLLNIYQVILEFSEKDSYGKNFFANELKNTKQIQVYHMDIVPSNVIKAILINNGYTDKEADKLIEKYEKEEYNLNIIFSKYVQNQSSTDIKNLKIEVSKRELEFIWLIYIHSMLSKRELIWILSRKYYMAENTLSELIRKKLVCKDKGFLYLNPAYTFESFKENSCFQQAEQMAYILCKQYYSKKPEKNLKLYLNICAKISPKDLINYVEQIYKNNTYSFRKSLELLNLVCSIFFENNAEINSNDPIFLNLLKAYYEFGQFEEAFQLLVKSKKDTKLLKIYNIILLNRLDDIEMSNNLITQFEAKDDREYLIIKIIELINFATLTKYSECHKIHNEIYQNDKYTKFVEYNDFIRLCEIYLPIDNAIQILSSHALQQKDRTFKAKTLLSLSMLCAWNGNLNIANKSFIYAKKNLVKSDFNLSILMNNEAVLRIHNNKNNFDTYTLLNSAFNLANNTFDKLSIAGNILVLQKNMDLNDNFYAKKALELIELEKDKFLIASVYNQLSYYYKDANDNLSEMYSRKENETINNTTVSGYDDVKRRLGYATNFIVYWHFSIDHFLARL